MSKEFTSGVSRKSDDAKTSLFVKLILILTAICIVLVLAYSLISSTGALKRMATAYTVGDEKVSAMDMSIHYYDVRSNMLNQYGDLLQSYGYTLDATLDAQSCIFDSSKTWKEYFLESAKSQAQQVAILCQEGKAAGYEMTDADKQKLDAYIASVEEAAAGYSLSVSRYLSAVYGAGTKLSDVESLYEKRYYAAGYYDVKNASFEVSDDDITNYYNENKDQYDMVDAYYYSFPYTEYTFTEGAEIKEGDPTSAEQATEMTDASKQAAKAKADAALANITTADTFDAAVKAVAEDEDFTTGLNSGLKLSDISSTDRGKWLADESRAPGDTTVLDNTTDKSYDVVLFVSRYRDTTQAASVRHILFKTQTAASDATDEEKASIQEANDKVLENLKALWQQWKDEGGTEDQFAALAEEKSEDTGSSTNGGLYEHFAEGTMVTSFNDWSFDPARKYGDTDIVESDYGYHLMYFVSNDGDYWYYSIMNTLRDNAYNEWYDGVSPNYAASVSSFGMNMVASN